MSTSSTSSSTTRVRSARTAWSTPMRWFATVTSTRWGSGIVCERALLRERTDVKVDRGHARQDDKDVNKRKKDNSQGERKKIKRRDAGNIAAMIMMRAPLQPSLRSSSPLRFRALFSRPLHADYLLRLRGSPSQSFPSPALCGCCRCACFTLPLFVAAAAGMIRRGSDSLVICA
jgi:hypothetical protein